MKKNERLSKLAEAIPVVLVFGVCAVVCSLFGLAVPQSVVEKAHEFKHLI